MSSTIFVEPVSPYANPTSVTLNGLYTLPATTRYLVRVTSVDSVSVLTVPSSRSYTIQNEGSLPFFVASTGNSNIQVGPSNQLQVAWDEGQAKHECQLTKNDPSTLKQTVIGSYTVTVGDISNKAAFIVPANATSSILIWAGGVAVGPQDAIFTSETGALAWAGYGLESSIEVGDVLQFIYVLA